MHGHGKVRPLILLIVLGHTFPKDIVNVKKKIFFFVAHGFTSLGPAHSPAHILAQRSSTMHLG